VSCRPSFRYPHVEPIWQAYLTSFVDRHKGSKLERARDLFLQVLALLVCLVCGHCTPQAFFVPTQAHQRTLQSACLEVCGTRKPRRYG
jgi:hypothetical protein